MSIYSPIIITEKIERNFKPTRLAIKELNGIRYFCKSIKKDIIKYTGSGVYWTNIIKKYGKENIKTIWVSDWFYCPHELQNFALAFSENNKIVESLDWANIIAENGLTGNVGSKKGHMAGIPKPKSDAHRKSISDTLTGITLEDRHGKEKADSIKSAMSRSSKGRIKTPEQIQKTANSHRGSKRSQESINKMRESHMRCGKITCVHCKRVFSPCNYHYWHGDHCISNPNRIVRPPRKYQKTNITNRPVRIKLNGVIYNSLSAASAALNIPRSILRKMLSNNITSDSHYKIDSLFAINDDSCEE